MSKHGGAQSSGRWLTVADITHFVTVDPVTCGEMIADAEAIALLKVPALATLTSNDLRNAQVKAVVRGAIIRWVEASSGVNQQMVMGPFSFAQQPGSRRTGMFYPSEVEQLREIMANPANKKAYSVDTAPHDDAHLEICSRLRALHSPCVCGTDPGGQPDWEG